MPPLCEHPAGRMMSATIEIQYSREIAAGVIWNGIPVETQVIPAFAGITLEFLHLCCPYPNTRKLIAQGTSTVWRLPAHLARARKPPLAMESAKPQTSCPSFGYSQNGISCG